jgi:hypothetical protein
MVRVTVLVSVTGTTMVEVPETTVLEVTGHSVVVMVKVLVMPLGLV